MACAYLYNHPSVRYNKNASVTSNCSPLVGVPFFFSRSFLMHSFTRLIEVMWCRCDWMKNVTALFSPCATCHWKAARIKALISSISPVLHRLSHIFSPIFQSFVFVCVCGSGFSCYGFIPGEGEVQRDMLSSMTDATIEGKERFWHELDWVSTFYYPMCRVCVQFFWLLKFVIVVCSMALHGMIFAFFCSRDIAIAVKFTVSHSAHPWPLDNKNYKQMFLIMLNGNGLNQCFFVFMQ